MTVKWNKLWLDDVRKPPTDDWVWCVNVQEAIELLCESSFDEISFDHDLGEEHTGYDLACWIEEQALKGKLKPLKWKVHSANPVGRENIKRAMEKADEFWQQRLRERTGGLG